MDTVEHDGAEIRRRRQELGYTAAQLAKRVKTSRPHITALETRTRTKRIGAPLYGRICRALGAKWGELLLERPPTSHNTEREEVTA
jgi:transcriptional regulator with XRE-family HTH domain